MPRNPKDNADSPKNYKIKDKYDDLFYREEKVPPSSSLSACLAVIFIENKIIAQRWRGSRSRPQVSFPSSLTREPITASSAEY